VALGGLGGVVAINFCILPRWITKNVIPPPHSVRSTAFQWKICPSVSTSGTSVKGTTTTGSISGLKPEKTFRQTAFKHLTLRSLTCVCLQNRGRQNSLNSWGFTWGFNTRFFDRPEILDLGSLGGPGRFWDAPILQPEPKDTDFS